MNLNILIADDQELNRMLLSKLATKLGHHVELACNGREALEKFAEHRPDLVLMDIMMPEMNGLDATAAIKSMETERWIPVIILSALSDLDNIVQGLKAGADDYITKPFQLDILNAKLNNFERGIASQRQIEMQNEELRKYHFQAEDEKRIASHLMQFLVNIDLLHASGTEWWLQPADSFSGDILAAAQTPAGMLHVMLGDGAGHGLAAALSAQPLPEIFYAMTSHGYTIGSIAQEINRHISRLLPVDHFFAATIAAIDTREQYIEVWNGGNPPALLIDRDGSLIHTFESRHLALGVVRNGSFSGVTERAPYPPGAQLIIMSDGLLDAGLPDASTHHSVDSIKALLAGTAPEKRLESIKQFVMGRLGGAASHDDISLLIADAGMVNRALPEEKRTTENTPSLQDGDGWEFSLQLNGSQLSRMSQDVVPFIMGAIFRLSDIQEYRSALFLILSELFNNSLDHGLLQLDSCLKNTAGGFENYLAERSSKLATLGPDNFIHFEISMSPKRVIEIVVRDSGTGFDHVNIMHLLAGVQSHHGRGLALIKGLGATLQYRDPGNEARVSLSIPGQRYRLTD